MISTTRRSNMTRRLATACIAVGSLFTAACASEKAISAPTLPGNGPSAQFRPLAFTADVDVRTGKVVIAAPTGATRNGPTLSLDGSETPNLSLLGGEAVRLVPSSYTASAVGAFTPNKIRVTFDVSIENKLPGVKFITPTWPVPPSTGVILFPLDFTVTTTPGGTTGGNENIIEVNQPSYGTIVPSIDWNGTRTAGSGAPYNFFNDADCSAAASNDCFRWEAFDLEILPLTGSTKQTVGFDIDASVAQFRTRMIVAADLAPAAAVAPGSITGTVSSAARGPLAGVTVTASSGQTAVTSVTGTYALADVNVGSRTVTLSNLPGGCTNVPSQTVSVSSGAASTLNFATITCTGLPGTINGTISSNVAATVLTGISVSASNGGGASAIGTALVSGVYSIANVAAGSGTLTVGNLPSGCTAPSLAYSLASAATSTVNIAIICPVPVTPGYQYNSTWENISATQVAVTLRIDMRTFNRADIVDYADPVNSVTSDPLTGAQLTVLFDASKLTYVARTIPSGSAFTSNATINSSVAGQLTIVAGGSDLISGNVGITRLIFNRAVGATGSVGTTTTITAAASRTGTTTVNITANVVNVETPFTLP